MIDTHAHLNDEKLFSSREEILASAKAVGVDIVVCVGSDIDTSREVVNLSKEFENIYAVVGYHPHDASGYNKETKAELIQLAKEKKVVAIGEIGLDFHYDFSPREIQREVFISQIKLANELDLPIVIHTREATEETIMLLKENQKLLKKGGILHCFSADKDAAKEYVKLGFLLGIGGVITFKNSASVREAVLEVGLENLVLETDCPYLAPVPFRGKLNEPKFVPYICKELASIFEVTEEEVAEITTKNAKRVYKI